MIVWVGVVGMGVGIFCRRLLYIVGGGVLVGLLLLKVRFMGVGKSYIGREEVLDKEEESEGCGGGKGKRFRGIM